MSSRMVSHPGDEQLLRYLDGELPPRAADAIRSHLDACWQCRTRRDDLAEGIGDFMRYRDEVIRPLSPAPPQPWRDLRPALAEWDLENPQPRRSHLRLWAVAAAMVLGVFLVRWPGEQVVNAAELLQRAGQAETTSTPPRRLQVRTGRLMLVRPAILSANDRSEIATWFAAAHYSWERPLSVHAYSAWRDGLREKQDQVLVRTGAERIYEIRTRTSSSSLREASLSLRASDLRPINGTWRFADEQQVELAELPDTIVPPVNTAQRQNSPSAPATTVTAAGPAEELRVLAALHDLGADLGEPIEVSRPQSGEPITVKGVGVSSTRRAQVQQALGSMSGVRLQWEDAQPVRTESAAASESAAAADALSPLQDALEKHLGSRTALDAAINQILDHSDAVLAHAHALKRLAERFDPAAEHALSSADQAVLHRIMTDHMRQIATASNGLAKQLQPVLTLPAVAAAARGSWQQSSIPLLNAAQRLDQMLNRALAGSDPARSPQPDEIALTLSQLRALAAEYEQ